MAKQTFTAGQVLTAAEMNSLQENDYNWTVTTKTASYTLAAGDEGTRIVMNNAGATTITVDDAVFSAGDVVWIHNIGAGTCTVTAGTATVNTAASLDLAQWEGGSLYFTSASSAIFFRGPAAGVATLEASGGTEVTSGGYKYHTFTSSGTLTVTTAGVCEILVVAGGGGGTSIQASRCGGGGGAGGLVNQSNVYLTDTTWTITVGAGGAGGQNDDRGGSGTASQIGGLICAVGGGGVGHRGYVGGRNVEDGLPGGSGGGAMYNGAPASVGGAGVLTQGNDGGDSSALGSAGGGGGAGGAGANGSGTTGAAGGLGLDFSTWATATSTGDNGYFASGGGGGGSSGGGSASDGGGGNGSSFTNNGVSGLANTGGGGGGAENDTATGGSGGSGIVIVRYAV